jgi:HlyD family secretion protein
VFIWRLTLPNSLANYLAWVVLSVLGARVFFNFNPLLKLDGYYLLSDLFEMPNLQQRALGHVLGRLRWLLWGAPRPKPEPRGKLLAAYGIASWLFGLGFLAFLIVAVSHFLGQRWGLVGVFATALLGVVVLRGSFQGLLAGEVSQMIQVRHRRAVLWVLGLGALAAALFLVHIEDRARGAFRVHPVVRVELRAPVGGFLQEAYFDEGSRVSPGAVAVRLEVPHLASRLAQKRAEVREVQARLRLLEAGPRTEEVDAQRRRVERAASWRDLAEHDLARARQAFTEELAGLDRQIAQHRAELEYARDVCARSQRLRRSGAVDEEQCRQAEKKIRVIEAQLEQAEARHRSRKALGVREAEAELVRRERELAEARASLTLLEAGTRPEEIEAERARLLRSQEELRYLHELQAKTEVHSPVGGVVTTPRLGEKVGQYFREGELICLIEEPSLLEAEILLPEQQVARVEPGQRVDLKVRTQPFQTFQTHVDRIAPRAVSGDAQSTVTVYCRLENPGSELRPGMVGYSRVYCGRRPIGVILVDRLLRLLRTEFWW